MDRRVLVLATLVVVGSLLAGSTAYACKCAYPTVRRSFPQQDEQDVPVDIAPLIFVAGQVSSSTVTWENAAGESVAFELRKGSNGPPCADLIELVPEQALEPRTAYVITITSSQPQQQTLRFTTGEQLVTQPLSAPAARLRILRTGPWRNSCMSGDLGCLELGPVMTEVLIPGKSREQFWVMVDGPTSLDVPVDTECVEFRTRNLAGRRSEPLRLCGDKLDVRELPENLQNAPKLTCSDEDKPEEAVEDDDSARADGGDTGTELVDESCSLGAPTRTRRTHASLMAFALGTAVLVLRRRRRH